jgi:hexosaminidase
MTNLIPLPKAYVKKEGVFTVSDSLTIFESAKLKGISVFLIDAFSKATKLIPCITDDSDTADIVFEFAEGLGREAYIIDINTDKIKIKATFFDGAFYSVQTLRQLFKLDYFMPKLTIECAVIEDEPRYSWRGILLDESRHFFGSNFVKKLIDLLSMHKLNVLHWHLSDNEGWRVEIKAFPKLIEIGSKRRGTHFLAWGKRDDSAVEWKPYSGHYTQDEIKEIVKYATDRNVMIVPEIDMPAHFGAVLAAYPEMGCRGLEIKTPIMHGGEKDGPGDLIACAGQDSTYEFIFKIIDELVELFPAPYFHIGGDEAPKTEWKKCSKCQSVIKANNLKDEEDLQGYFNNRIAEYLKTKNKVMIGWNEVLKSPSLARDTLIQYWHPVRDKRVEKWIQSNGKVIISKHQAFYFDMPYAMRNLKTTYNFEPSKYKLNDEQNGVLGLEATLWTEWIRTEDRLFFQLFPRLEALSEISWSPKEKKNYTNFRARLSEFVEVLDKMMIPYAPLNIVDTGVIKTLKVSGTFIKSNAHVEYEEAKQKK